MPTTVHPRRPSGIVAAAVTAAALPMAGWAAHASRLRRQLDAAGRDQLTGAWRRDGFQERARRILARHPETAVVVFADNDHFRQLNTEFGHAVGDQVLIATAARLMAWAGRLGVVGRLGGGADEFVAATRLEAAHRGARLQQLVDALAEPVDVGGTRVEVAVSVAAACPEVLGTTDLGLLMRCADHALMTRAKHTGIAHQAVLADLDAPGVNGRLAGRPGTAAPGVYAA